MEEVMQMVQLFNNPEFGDVRTVIIDGEPWFVANDIAADLQYKDYSDAILTHTEKEDRKVLNYKAYGVLYPSLWEKTNDFSNKTLINESGVYSLIFGSDMEKAKEFKHWITAEVLPTIRKTGGYVNNDELFINTYFPNMPENQRVLFRVQLKTVREQNELIQKQQTKIEAQAKEIEHKEDVIIGCVKDITVADKRAILGRVVKHNGANYKERWNALYREFNDKFHCDVVRRKETYNLDHKPKMHSTVEYIDVVMNMIPELYELAVKLYENDVKELVQEMYDLNQIRHQNK